MAEYCKNCKQLQDRLDEIAASRQSRSKALLAEAIDILRDCEQKWGCECPYCDRDFGNKFESHADDCRLKRFLDTANSIVLAPGNNTSVIAQHDGKGEG